jgi:glutathione peroxidase
MKVSIYDFKAKSLQGQEIDFKEYQNKVILIVNTASECGFTPQYEGLQKLFLKYKEQGLVVLGFPCNQFGKQEPGNKEEILNTCQINFGVTFQMFEKVDVNGKNQHPLFEYLKKNLPGFLWTKNIKWNFTKFLLDQNGKPIKRFGSTTTPEQIEPEIKKLLSKK